MQECPSAPNNHNANRCDNPQQNGIVVRTLRECEQFTGEVDHRVEQDHCERTAVCVVVDPGEDKGQRNDPREEPPECGCADAQP